MTAEILVNAVFLQTTAKNNFCFEKDVKIKHNTL